MSGPVVHPEGCRCPGCLPGQYVMRPAPQSRPQLPARRPDPQLPMRRPRRTQTVAEFESRHFKGTVALFALAIPATLLLAGLGWLYLIPSRISHTDPAGPATWLTWSAIVVIVALIVKLGMVLHARKQPPPPERPALLLSVAKCAALGHPGRVPVDNDELGRLAWWCPSCETQLEADWKPALPGDPPSAENPLANCWTWRWWCTDCGMNFDSIAPTEARAKAAIARHASEHEVTGHHWESEWGPQ